MIDPTMTATVQTPSVAPPSPAPPVQPAAAAGTSSFCDCLNMLLSQKLATAIVKKQKMQYSILHFEEYNPEWWMCEVENFAGNQKGDELFIVIAKTSPIMLYPAGAISAPSFTN